MATEIEKLQTALIDIARLQIVFQKQVITNVKTLGAMEKQLADIDVRLSQHIKTMTDAIRLLSIERI